MISNVLLLFILIASAWSFPSTDGGDSQIPDLHTEEMDELRTNISSLWNEVNSIKDWVKQHDESSHHHHIRHDDGHHHHHHHDKDTPTQEMDNNSEDQYNQTLEMKQHHDDHHFHYSGHSHAENSDNAHSKDHHHHGDSHGMDHHHHGNSHDMDHHHHGDSHDMDHHHHDDSHDVEHQHRSSHGDHHHGDNSSDEGKNAESSQYGQSSHRHRHPDRSTYHGGYHHGGKHSVQSEENSRENDDDSRERSYPATPNRSDRRLDLSKQTDESDPITLGFCDLKPNVEMPESRVLGNVTILQKKYGKESLYYQISVRGLTVGKDKASRTHGFHIHEKALSGEGKCNSAGAHYNPTGSTHGSKDSVERHLGDFGNIVVNRYGTLDGYSVEDRWNKFNDVVGKSFVVHELPDDLGKAGDAGSLATGNAGKRLACCTIHADVDLSIRFNG